MVSTDLLNLGFDTWDDSSSTHSLSSLTYSPRAHAPRDHLQATVASAHSKKHSQHTSQTRKGCLQSASYFSNPSEAPSHHGIPIEPLQRE